MDLLVRESDFKRFCDTVSALGYVRLKTAGRGPHRVFVAYDRETDSWIKLDVVIQLAYGPHHEFTFTAIPAASCLDRRDVSGEVPVLNGNDAFWTLLLHCLLDKGRIEQRHIDQLRRFAGRSDDSDWLLTLSMILPSDWTPARVRESAGKDKWEEIEQIAPAVRRRARSLGSIRRVATNSALRRCTKVVTLFKRQGIAVVLLGPDGAGKSTLAKSIDATFYFPVRTMYAGLYPAGTRPSRLPGVGLASKLLHLRRLAAKATFHRARGRLVVFDRYAYDALLNKKTTDRARSKLRRWLLVKAAPPPHLTVILDAPGEVLFERKFEHNIAFLESQRERYRALAESRPGMVLVDSTQGAETVRQEVVDLIWRRYASFWNSDNGDFR